MMPEFGRADRAHSLGGVKAWEHLVLTLEEAILLSAIPINGADLPKLGRDGTRTVRRSPDDLYVIEI